MNKFSQAELDLIYVALEKLQSSHLFSSSKRLLRLITYLLEATLKSAEHKLNQSAIAIDVFDRDESFDSAIDSVVRVEAGRLRNKLREYYELEAGNAAVRFELPKGHYALNIHFSERALQDSNILAGESVASAKNTQNVLSIAVLPFELISDQAGDASLADAIAISIIDRLGRGTTFETVSHRSAFAYKGRYEDAREIAKVLNVKHVMEACMRRSGECLRFSVAVINGDTGRLVWSGLYEYATCDDIFALESNVTEDVVNALASISWRLIAEAKPVIPDPLATDQQSLMLIFNVSQLNCRLGKEQALRAIADCPESAENYGFLAFHLMQEVITGWSDDPEKTCSEGLTAAAKALELDKLNVRALWGASEAFMWLGESARGLRVMERLALMHPDDLFVQGFYGHNLLHSGYLEKGLGLLKESIASSPNDYFMPPLHFFTSLALTMLGRFDEAVVAGEYACQLVAGHPQVFLNTANALALLAEHRKAEEYLADALRLSPGLNLDYVEKVYKRGFTPSESVDQLTAGLKQLQWP
jgi:TolB-like protein